MPIPNFKIQSHARTDTGHVRPQNEDCFIINKKIRLYILADGMGGAAAGEIASQMVCEELNTLLPPIIKNYTSQTSSQRIKNDITKSLKAFNKEMYNFANQDNNLKGMGTTVVIVLIINQKAYIFHVGDSRCYLLRNKKLRLLTKDQSFVQVLIDKNEITPEQALTHPARSEILQCMGSEQNIKPNCKSLTLKTNDQLLLCSDGLNGMIPDNTIENILNTQPTIKKSCAQLISAANKAGGDDNITTVLIKWS